MAKENEIKIDILIDTVNSTESLTALRKATKQLQDELGKSGKTAEEIGKIEKALSTSKEQFEDLTAKINAGKDGGLQGLSNLGRNIASSFTIATGAIGLFGSKNEELNAVINKVNSAIVLLSGVQAFADAKRDAGILRGLVLSKIKLLSIEKESAAINANTVSQELNTTEEAKNTIVTGANTAAKNANTVGTTALIIAQKALNAVVSFATGPWGLLTTIIAAITIGYAKLTQSTKELTEEEKKLAEGRINAQNAIAATDLDNDVLNAQAKLDNLKAYLSRYSDLTLEQRNQLYNEEQLLLDAQLKKQAITRDQALAASSRKQEEILENNRKLEKDSDNEKLLAKKTALALESEALGNEYVKQANLYTKLEKDKLTSQTNFESIAFANQQKRRQEALKAIENFYKTSNELSQRYTNDTLAIEKKAIEKATQDKIQKEREAFNAVVNSQIVNNAQLKKLQDEALANRNEKIDNETAALEKAIAQEATTLGKQRDINIKRAREEAQGRFDIAERAYQEELVRAGKQFEDKNTVVKAASIRLTTVETSLLEDKNRLLTEKDKEFTLKLEEQKLQLQLDSAKLRGEQTAAIELQILDNKFEQEKLKVSDNDKLTDGLTQARNEKVKAQYEEQTDLLQKSIDEDTKKIKNQGITRQLIDFEGQEKYLAYLTNTFDKGKALLDKQFADGTISREKYDRDLFFLQQKYEIASLASQITFTEDSKKIMADEQKKIDLLLTDSLTNRLEEQKKSQKQELDNLISFSEDKINRIKGDPKLNDEQKGEAIVTAEKELEDAKTAIVKEGVAERTRIIAEEVNAQVQLYAQVGNSLINAAQEISNAIIEIQNNRAAIEAQQREQDYVDLSQKLQDEAALETQALYDKYNAEIEAKKLTNEYLNASDQERAELLKQIEDEQTKKVAEAQRKQVEAKFKADYDKAVADNKAITDQNARAKKAFEIQKALQIALVTMNTVVAASAAFATLAATTVGLPLAPIVAAAIGVAGAAQVATIAATKFVPGSTGALPTLTPYDPSSASGGSSGSGGSQQSQFVGGFDFNNSSLFGQAYPFPMSDQRVYVLESDITSTQGRVATIEDRNTF